MLHVARQEEELKAKEEELRVALEKTAEMVERIKEMDEKLATLSKEKSDLALVLAAVSEGKGGQNNWFFPSIKKIEIDKSNNR